MTESRQNLIELSKIAKMAISFGEETSVNEYLIDEVYQIGHLEKKTFNQWKKEGKKVKKGEKGFAIWSKPIEKPKKETPEEGEETKPEKVWGIAYLFTELQVEDGTIQRSYSSK